MDVEQADRGLEARMECQIWTTSSTMAETQHGFAGLNTRPIHQAANTPAQIMELFDGIAYGKAAAVLRMLESYLGEETFRAGVNAYIQQQHQYANATATDFWDAQTRTSKKPVDQMMPTFVDQAGVPNY